ncbi:MAG: PQQ-binding-like beta-propeller repeat protein [Pseudomonadota bacterium]
MLNLLAPAVALSLGLTVGVPAALADFVVDDQIISDTSSDLPAPEFDEAENRMIWQDRFNQLWIARVDPITGDISPADGRGTLVDTGLASVGEVGNTPRMSYGEEDVLIYTKDVEGTKWLAVARNVGPATWTTELLEQGDNRLRANGTQPGFTGTARMVYNRILPDGEIVVSWRDWNDPASEGSANVVAEGGRFLGTEPTVLTLATDDIGRTQVMQIDLATGDGELITSSPNNKINPFIWFAPEFNDFAFVLMINFTDLAVYRRIDGVWTEYNRFVIPSDKPLLSSPEAFSLNGRSYVTVVAADELGQGDTFPGQPVGPSEIWLAGIDPDAPFFRRIDDPLTDEQRSEPEPYMLPSGPVAYYTERLAGFPGTRFLRRADTGLGPSFAYDLPASYGGPWAGSNRDNRNCNCVPFAIGDAFTAGAPIDVPGAQFAWSTLASDGTLLFSSRNNNLGVSELIALDTNTGAEKFRIDESQTGTQLAQVGALIDRDGNFYVTAQEAITKFAPDGSVLWSTPVIGLSRGAQFLPDGRLVMFTWNAQAYILDPADGTVLGEQQLSPNRNFPATPNCLLGGAEAACAYASAIAVESNDGTVYASLTRGTGAGLLQAFDYDPQTVTLTSRWGFASPALTRPASAPVVSPAGDVVYTQERNGTLSAINPATPAIRWQVSTGISSKDAPALNGDLIMPAGTAADGATGITVYRNTGAAAEIAFQSTDYLPRSLGAAAGEGRFVLAVEEVATGDLLLAVIDVTNGTLSTSPWAAGVSPNTLRALTVRQDGAVVVQAWGRSDNVVVFTPAP